MLLKHNVLRLILITVGGLIPGVMFRLCLNHTLGDLEKPCIRVIAPVLFKAIMLNIH